jgi:RNA polymerase sigma-70 factor (ECF subfamily)
MDDQTAIERCQNGEREAFRFLVERYQRQAVGHAAAILGNREDALDAVQEAFIDAFQAIRRFDKSRRFYPWFYVLLRNRCYKALQQAQTLENIEETVILAPAAGISREESLTLESALLALSGEEREIITLKYMDGLSYDEIAERLNIPRGTVMSRLFYARRQLQARLTGKFH